MLAWPGDAFCESAGPRGSVRMSDGTAVSGEIFGSSEDSTLRVFDENLRKYREFKFAEIVSVSMIVEKEAMVDKFTFKEVGWDEKLYSGKAFPRIDFRASVLLLTGERAAGHVLGVVHVDDGTAVSKFVLNRYMRGEVGQKLDDLVYVREIAFEGRVAKGGGALAGRTAGLDGRGQLFAIESSSPLLLPVERTAGGAEFRKEHLAPGTYDFVFISDEAMHLALSPPPDAGGPMNEAALAEIRARVDEIEEFFTKKEIVIHAGGDRAARVLLRKTRTEKSTYDKVENPRFHRFEIWSLRKTGERWIVESRTYLARGTDAKGGSASEKRVVRVTGFGGHKVEAGKTLDVVLEAPAEKKR